MFPGAFVRVGRSSLQDGPRVSQSVARLSRGRSGSGRTGRPIDSCGSRGSGPFHLGLGGGRDQTKPGTTLQVPRGRAFVLRRCWSVGFGPGSRPQRRR